MEYRLGNLKNIKTLGDTLKLVCPKCGNETNFSVFSNGKISFTAKLPLIDKNNVFFLVCPECASVFAVDEAKGNSFKNGQKLSIGNFDLESLKEFK